jgi:arsenate reductase-like glutaredoxin family protein
MQGFLAQRPFAVATQVDARKETLQRDRALEIARSVAEIWVAKGKKVTHVAMKDRPGDEELAALLLGPTGNLRAPAIRRGKTLIVGFDEETYKKVLGA